MKEIGRAVVVAQVAERLLPIPEIQGSNPGIGIFLKKSNDLQIILENKQKRL